MNSLRMPNRRPGSLHYRFLVKIEKQPGPDGCWLWTARVNDDGYGEFRAFAKNVKAHFYSFVIYKGPVPQGLEIDHECKRRNCVNPRHLRAIPHAKNVIRGEEHYKRQQTHCQRGHEFTAANTGYNREKRYCRACSNAAQNARKRKYREARQCIISVSQ